MPNVVEAELRLKGSDHTAAAFAGVIKHAEELRAKLASVNLRAGTADLAAQGQEIRRATALARAHRQAVQEINLGYRAGNEILAARQSLFGRMRQTWQGMASVSGMGWMVGGLASGRLTRSIASNTADFAHQRALLATASGMSPVEVSRAVDEAIKLRVPMMSAADNLKAIGELRMVFGSTEHAIEHLASVQRAAAMMKAVNPHMNGEEESYNLARALELKGVSNDPHHFTRLADMMVQAVNASRGKITGSEFFEFTKYARGAASQLDDKFYTRVAPTLIQELGGHSAGMALSSFRQTLVGGKMTNKAAEEWVKLGLINPAAVIHTNTGSVKGIRPGGLIDSALANTDPYAWIQAYLKPALAKHKITDQNKIAEELAHLFSNRFSEQMASILLNQSQRIEKDWGLIDAAPNSEALEKLREQDPKAALGDLAAGISSLLASLGSPLAGAAVTTMNGLADGARYIAERYGQLAKDHPWVAGPMSAAAAGGLGYVGVRGAMATWGIFTGSTALKGSAVALNSSAAALDAAAARLAATALPRTAAPIVSTAGTVGGVVGGGAFATRLRNVTPKMEPYFAPWALAAFSIATTPDVFTTAPNGRSWDDVWKDQQDPLGLEHLTDKNRGAFSLGGIHDRLSGNAEITTKVTVEPSPDFLTRVEQRIMNAIHSLRFNDAPPGGTSGSTGGGMPEAVPYLQP